MGIKSRIPRILLVGLVLPAAGYLTFANVFPQPVPQTLFERLGVDIQNFDPDTISPSLAQELGLRSRFPAVEIVGVLVSSTFCIGSRTEGFDEAVSKIPDLLRSHATGRADVIARMVGVSVDTDPIQGSQYLSSLAHFDEIVAGGNWLNTATEKLFWGGLELEASIPQLVVLRRSLTWVNGRAVLDDEKVIDTVVGGQNIIDWVSAGGNIRLSMDGLPDEAF